MMLQSRLRRLEQAQTRESPLEALSDEELEFAMQTVRASIEEAAGMSVEAYVDLLEGDIQDGRTPPALDPSTVDEFVAAMKKDFRQAHDQLRGTA